MKQILYIVLIILFSGCQKKEENKKEEIQGLQYLKFSHNTLDYIGTPKNTRDKDMLMYSDQGAWFAYSLSDSIKTYGGFSGPYLMTQENGVWSSQSLVNLDVRGKNNTKVIDWNTSLKSKNSFSSHLEQIFENKNLQVKQELVYSSGHTALLKTKITNISEEGVTLHPSVSGELFDIGITTTSEGETIVFSSEKSEAKGYLKFLNESASVLATENYYKAHFETIFLKPNQSKEFIISQTFIFPEYVWQDEESKINKIDFDSVIQKRKTEKDGELKSLIKRRKNNFDQEKYAEVLAKAHLTLQNNWRIPAGEIKYEGLFPSYHYKWFNGFWSWDSWKHAVGLSYYDLDLAKDQVKLMFEFQEEDGFVADCVYRDTTIEAHNYRDTKPPLSTWAVAKIFEKDEEIDFIRELYPKLKKYHYWWYNKRDHDQDGLCEYGSTDGSLVAAKWESGMDNAIRFDQSKIIKNVEGAYSLNQESVDLNAYLYAEKLYLAILAKALQKPEDAKKYETEAEVLKTKIQEQFYDPKDGWFYDTDLEGTVFIKGEGSEGWTALWANAATQEQAKSVKDRMMDPLKFYTKVPFQTMSADHEKFNPLKGYWRGPNWLDQAYFGVKGLHNYGFVEAANKATIQILEGAEGVLGKGKAIRENYHPITGEGLNAQNFSWSAAHIIMLLIEE
ncbi:MGH1-like glycoside hydrolase domain-containing protein [Aquimarina sp. 2201CG5-10]|uniref:MGH1-like glycoside hydrolase domain-containing protein n=1 Tax=Aquimarina callyspongiae TaxID=3098150 RepID=UPI002AB58F93|nr:trehalase family glycosidase [Aquimarina sp. 2201CG5-10]MDY8134836.1 trehalase family glycosidase [Aquimarina sp. 2201CG5-10]